MFGAPALPRTLEAALRDVSSKKARIRAEAARELVPHVEANRTRVVRALEQCLRDEDAGVRAAAAMALGDVKGSEALAALLIAIEDDDGAVRQMAIVALGELGDGRATERLRRALSDPRPEVRFQAVMAFPRVTSHRDVAMQALIDATRDSDPLVVHIAIRMAEELCGAGALDDAMLARARALVAHPSALVRTACAIVVANAEEGEVREDGAREVLVDLLNGVLETSDVEDEAAAIELAGELGLEGARPGLERRAFGGPLGRLVGRGRYAWLARVALARMGHARACREIVGELGSWQRDKRTLAVAAAGRARLVAARELIASMRGDDSRADPVAVAEALVALEGARSCP
jgi:HEAT repeat protein